MINVVFLLLIFLLMTAQVAPTDPLEVDLPESAVGTPGALLPVLQVSRAGVAAFGKWRGAAALEAIAGEARGRAVIVRADAALPAEALAQLLVALQIRGVEGVQLATVTP